MIDFIFTLDYEIYGNGTGSLREHVYRPAEELRICFAKWDAPFVNFVEVAEFEKIEHYKSDPDIGAVLEQVHRLHEEGHETALHLHPQWCNSKYDGVNWHLDYSEYNLCLLATSRIEVIATQAISYLRRMVKSAALTPLAFRAGNWLFQPTKKAAEILAGKGLRIDSSVFKGGFQHSNSLDYRGTTGHGYCWRFEDQVTAECARGTWIEIPIYTEQVSPLRMLTKKRLSASTGGGAYTSAWGWGRVRDLLRLRYPLKLDFCRMALPELIAMLERVLAEDRIDPEQYRPVVAIGHTKDLNDVATVDGFLKYLRRQQVSITTFRSAYPTLLRVLGY